MHRLPLRLALSLVCLVAASEAQPTEPPAWSQLRAKNPAGTQLTLRLSDPHPYAENELIRADISFPGKRWNPPQPMPRERWQFAGFLVDPTVGCGSLAQPCVSSAALWIQQVDPVWNTGSSADQIVVSLNNSLPAFAPGRHQVALLMRKLVAGPGPMSNRYLEPAPPQFAISNVVAIETLPASQEWTSQAIARSVANLASPAPNTPEAYQQREMAAEQLRFLDTPAAWRASLALLPVEELTLLQGLAGTREPARVCALMRTAVQAPAQVVSSNYLYAAAQTCARAGAPPEPSAASQAYWLRRRDDEQILTETLSAQLAASLPRKQFEPQAAAFQTLLERLQPGRAVPPWLPTVKAAFFAAYPKLASHQRSLLNLYASRLRTADMIPLLEAVIDAWKPGDYFEDPNEALRNLYAIDPARAQARIVAELSNPRTWLRPEQLQLLPASTARISDSPLIETAGFANGNARLGFTALAKYASGAVLPQVKSIYEAQKNPCQPELAAYFVRVDPAYADRIFHAQPWDLTAEPPPCARQYFERTPRIAMGPVLERYMTAYLMHRVVHIKTAAAQSLGHYGSPAAREPLWQALRYFHTYWQGKAEQLARNGEGSNLEVELRNALARATHWLATEADLRTMESLCVSGRCLDDVHQDLGAWHKPLKIQMTSEPGDFRAQVAQYDGIPSIEALEDKLGQFPAGTQFLLSANGEGADSIRHYAAQHGLAVTTH